MEQLCAGQTAALDELLQLYWQPLVRYAARLLESADAAEDVAQQSFVLLWERRSGWQEGGSVPAYLYRVARNLCVSERRKQRVRSRRGEQFRREVQRAPVRPDQVTEGRELQAAAQAALQELPGRRREVFELVRFHGLSYREVSEVMAISPQTVANQMSAALAHIRGALDSHLNEVPPATSLPPLPVARATQAAGG